MSKTVTIIDTFGFFFRSFYALPQHLSNKEGFPTGLLTGFVNFISSLQKEHSSDYLVFAIDSKGDTFRNEIDPNYKANRSAPPHELTLQLPVAIEWIDKMGFRTLGMTGYEADDMIATVASIAVKKGYNVKIVSHDKDLYQLIDDDKVVLVDAIKRKTINEAECMQKYGVTPGQFIDFQSLLGDSADNIPGVKGIGKVTAQKLISTYKTLENIYENIDDVTPAGVQKKLIENKENAFMSKRLVTLRKDVFDEFDFDEYEMHYENPFIPIYDELVHYEMNAILRSLHAKGVMEEQKTGTTKNGVEVVYETIKEPKLEDFKTTLITNAEALKSVLAALKTEDTVAFDTETTGLDPYKDTLVGFSFCFDAKQAFYVPLAHSYLGVPRQIDAEDAKEAIKKIFACRVVGHNIKFDLHFVTKFLREDLDIYGDSMILAWLHDPEGKLSLDHLSKTMLNHTMISFKDTVKKGETFASVEVEDACRYAAEDALITLRLYNLLVQKFKHNSTEYLLEEASNVEYPFISTLLRMEQNGITVDDGFLTLFLQEVKLRLASLTKDIYAAAGCEFNLNSPQQLGTVLFETLGLPSGKKTKTGYSTDEKVLSALIGEHEIIRYILDYREVHKLYSTYIEPLLKLSQESADGRVHTSFVQTGTATGRLSSKNPNLQNIPVRSDLGVKIRRGFTAPKGKKLVGIDYSQIELRLLAHFSEDEVLVDAFKEDKDIHLQTAIVLFGEEEAAGKRNIAKTVNFGLLYGMGQKKLSDTLNISTKEAKDIITKYFEKFHNVKEYFNYIIEESKEKGYVETLLRRRRYFDYAKATPMLKAAYERESVNTKFQGSVSDLIKLSMNKIDEIIRAEDLGAKMLLQIHDELIFEIDEDAAEELGLRFKKIMEEIYELKIPLKASLNIGDNWGELK
ncbi:DNA polymerase I [Sulfurimonas sp. HSL-1716]|uniref:DNA polymerase I n=1 Tax=Hydrocurvibacter sulfurireducens TaxID=3131937 RepID=UPI0031F87691